MSDIIHLLPDSVANQIAAGEVVQRPASIVKEMVENSIDAGADDIEVRAIDGGKNCVQVIDNGCGMSETDARMAFERHATSKIKDAKDIYQLTTMGFRGEALASIAAVAQVELTTRRPEDEIGTFIQIEGAKVTDQKPVACPVGTNFSVRNLFYNIPVRRKFLKKTQTELNNIIQDFERIALVYPDVKMRLFHNDAPLFTLDRTNLKTRILEVCGKKMENALLPVEAETSIVNVSGFVGKPEHAKKKGARQFFFVNGRFMKHPYFHSAVERAFDDIVQGGEHVDYFIYLDIDPQNLDVNVHPTKTEIKFENEQIIWQIINACVREAIGKFNAVPSIDFNRSSDDIYIPVMNPSKEVKMTRTPSSFNPFDKTHTEKPSTYNWESLYPDSQQDDGGEPKEVVVRGALSNKVPEQTSLWNDGEGMHDVDVNLESDENRKYINVNERYIVTTLKSGLGIVDQHRAHVKILFHEYMERMRTGQTMSQGMLFPEIIHLSTSEEQTFWQIEADIKALGFELTPLGNGAFSMNGIPSGMEGRDYDKLLHSLLWVAEENKNSMMQDVKENMALAMAQHSAVGYGQKLSDDEMKHIIKRLMTMSNPFRTPDGKVIVHILEQNDFDKLFK